MHRVSPWRPTVAQAVRLVISGASRSRLVKHRDGRVEAHTVAKCGERREPALVLHQSARRATPRAPAHCSPARPPCPAQLTSPVPAQPATCTRVPTLTRFVGAVARLLSGGGAMRRIPLH